jgi:hypothetical protein
MSQAPVNVEALWRYVTDQVKARVTLPGLWRAMEAARPITLELETDRLVLGFNVQDAHQGGLLLDVRHRNVIEQTLEAATRKRLRIEIINGETLADWEMLKQNQVEAQRLQQQTKQQILQKNESGESWEAVGDQIIRRYTAIPNRGLASVQGRFLEEAIQILVEAYPRLMPEEPDEHDERGYSRAVERLGERIGVPGPIISHLVHVRLNNG